MKKFFIAFMLVFLSSVYCSAAVMKTGVLIIAPTEYKTQDFLKIATEQFGKNYDISQELQDDWAAYCWDKGLTVSDPLVTKATLTDFAATTRFNKIIFIIFKNVTMTKEDLGPTVNVTVFGANRYENIRRRANIEARVVIMNNSGETLKVFEEAHTDASMASELRANRGAFQGLCKNISARLKKETFIDSHAANEK